MSQFSVEQQPATISVDDLQVGDVVVYPCWVGPRVEHLPRTVSSFVEYPKTRVVYWAEGGCGIADRSASLKTRSR